MSKKIITRTGGKAPVSGQYNPLGTNYEITLSKGERVPPYQKKANRFTLKDRTKHKK